MKNNHKYYLLALLASALLMGLSCGTQNHAWKGTIEEVDGVTVVRNPGEPLYGNDVYTIKEDLEIGDEGGDENFVFSFISYLAVDNEKNIYVADTREKHVKVFDSSGQFLRTIGRAGQGPGEFGSLAGIHIHDNNELVITDSRQRRMHYFSLGGEFLRTKDLGVILAKIPRMFPG